MAGGIEKKGGKKPAKKTGIHGFGSSGSTVKALNKPVKPGKTPKSGLMTLAQVAAATAEHKKKRTQHQADQSFTPDKSSVEVEAETEADDLALMHQRAVHSDDESDDSDKASDVGVVAESGDEQEEENEDGTIVKNGKKAKQTADQDAVLHQKLNKRAARYHRKLEKQTDRAWADSKYDYDVKDEEIDPKDLLPNDDGGLFMLQEDDQGDVYDQGNGAYIDKTRPAKPTHLRLSRTQPCPRCGNGSVPLHNTDAECSLKCKVDQKTIGQLMDPFEKKWDCLRPRCDWHNTPSTMICAGCHGGRPWKCLACEHINTTNTRPCGNCTKGLRPLNPILGVRVRVDESGDAEEE